MMWDVRGIGFKGEGKREGRGGGLGCIEVGEYEGGFGRIEDEK